MRVLLATTCTPDDRKTVAAARSLGRAGAWVAVGGDQLLGQAYYSRFVRRRVRYPHPKYGPAEFIDALNKHIERDRYDVVLPMNDYTTLALSMCRDMVNPTAVMLLPSREAVDIARDKGRTAELARQLGIETPATFVPRDEEELREIADRVGYPCVVKLPRGAGAVGLQFPRNREELLAAFATPRGASDIVFDHAGLLVQEYAAGETRDACVLCRFGEPRAVYAQRRRWMFPLEGGVGTSLESIREPELLDRAVRILKALEWHGPAEVEFRVEPHTGRIRLIEINGRFWGAVDGAIQAGVNFPLLTCRMALEGDVAPVFDYKVGQRYRFPIPFGLLAMMEPGSRRRAVREFFGPARGARSDLVWSDPAPLLAEVWYRLRRRG